jgi:hypothetical protein
VENRRPQLSELAERLHVGTPRRLVAPLFGSICWSQTDSRNETDFVVNVLCTRRGRFCVLAGGPVLEGAPVCLRAGVYGPAEMLAQVGCGREPALSRDCIDRQVAHLQESLGELDTLP